MKYYFTDLPEFHPADLYKQAIAKMTSKLMETGKVKTVFQIGGINAPGISDIDLYVVFKDDVDYHDNPVKTCNYPDSYFFIHNLFGCSESFAKTLEQYTYFKKYDHLAGEPFNMLNYHVSAEDDRLLKNQIALEYLVKAWFSINLGKQSGFVKIRSLLLHAKALLYDLEFLNMQDHPFSQTLNEVIDVRNNWFSAKVSDSRICTLVDEYENGLREVVKYGIEKHHFYITPLGNVNISNKSAIVKSNNFNVKRNGLSIPSILIKNSDFFLRANNRLNSYSINIPFESENIPDIISKRDAVIRSAIQYNKQHLPGFICTAYGSNVFSK